MQRKKKKYDPTSIMRDVQIPDVPVQDRNDMQGKVEIAKQKHWHAGVGRWSSFCTTLEL